jgi:hypothetical protein
MQRKGYYKDKNDYYDFSKIFTRKNGLEKYVRFNAIQVVGTVRQGEKTIFLKF